MGNVRDRFVVHQFTLTPNTETKGLLKILLNPSKLIVKKQFSKFVDDKSLEKAVRNAAQLKWNILWFDYVNLIPVLVDFMIGMNFPYKLLVLKASVVVYGKEFDVTENCQKMVKRDNSLFVLDFSEDLQLELDPMTQGRFELEYQFGEATLGFKGKDEVPFRRYDSYLLNFPKVISKFM
jgi:hypothetical protein